MNFFDSEYNDLHEEAEQLKRQKSALDLEMDYVDCVAQEGKIRNYEVTLEDCTCVDFQRRHKPCKHMYALAVEIGAFKIDEDKVSDIDAKKIKLPVSNIQRYPVDYVWGTLAHIPKDFVVIDFETANGFADSICQMGIAVVDNNKITCEKSYLIRPTSDKFTNTHIHGIKFSDVKDAPNFAEIWSEVREYLQGKTVAAYNLPFDMGCLCAVLDRYEIDKPDISAFDILLNARVYLDCSSYRLSNVAQKLGIRNERAHDALNDAEATAKIQIYLSEHSACETELYFTTVQSITDAILKSKISLSAIIKYLEFLVKKEKILIYEDYKEMLKLLDQIAAINNNGMIYQYCGMLYERFERFPHALSLYKKAVSLDKTLRLRTRIQKLERQLRSNTNE